MTAFRLLCKRANFNGQFNPNDPFNGSLQMGMQSGAYGPTPGGVMPTSQPGATPQQPAAPAEPPATEEKSFMGIKDDSLLGTALDWVPGVGTVYAGGKAIRDFSQGNIWGGLGNTAFAALGLVPFAGPIAKGVGRLGKLFAGSGRLSTGVRNVAKKWDTVNSGGRQVMGVTLGNKNFGLRTGQIKTTGALTAAGMGASAMEAPKAAPAAGLYGAYQQSAPPPGHFYADPNAGASAMGSQWAKQVMPQMKSASAWRTLMKAGI